VAIRLSGTSSHQVIDFATVSLGLCKSPVVKSFSLGRMTLDFNFYNTLRWATFMMHLNRVSTGTSLIHG